MGSNLIDLSISNRGRFDLRLNWFERVAAKLENHPDKMLWASAQNSLGIDYQEYPLGNHRENLRRAIATYTAALEYFTPAAAPLAYAGTQNNLGNAYRNLAQIEDQADNLRQAIAAFEAALEYRTSTTAPLDYAMTQRNLGIAYEDSGELSAAVACWREAERYYRQMGVIEQADLRLKWIEDSETRLANNKETKRWWQRWR